MGQILFPSPDPVLAGDPNLRPKQPEPGRFPAKTAGSRPGTARTAGMDGIWPFPGQNGQISPGWMESGRSRPASEDGRDLALSRPDWPGLFGWGLCRRGEWSGISGSMLCFRHGIFTDRWKGHFCLYVLKYFLIHFTIKLMWSHYQVPHQLVKLFW
jgi:hypothetical protein